MTIEKKFCLETKCHSRIIRRNILLVVQNNNIIIHIILSYPSDVSDQFSSRNYILFEQLQLCKFIEFY